jgi:hypothetical protein
MPAKPRSHKAWSGRMAEATHPLVDAFTTSYAVDSRLYPYDIAGSIAHCRMLAKQRIISQREAQRIERGRIVVIAIHITEQLAQPVERLAIQAAMAFDALARLDDAGNQLRHLPPHGVLRDLQVNDIDGYMRAPADLIALNPLSKIPTMTTDDGQTLFVATDDDRLAKHLPSRPGSAFHRRTAA